MKIKPSLPQTLRQKMASRNDAAETTTSTTPAKGAGGSTAAADSYESATQSRFAEVAESTVKRDVTDLASKIDAGKLQNLKQKLDGIDQAAVGRGKWDSFKDLGAKAGTKGGVLGQLKEQTGSGKKQEMIFGSKGSQLSTFGGSLVSNEPAGGAGGADGAKDDATLEKGAKGLSLLISLVSSRSAPIPMPSTPSSREEVRNLRSFAAILKTLIGGDYSGHVDRRGGIDPKDKTPTPDGDATGGRTIITSEQLRGLAAILGSLIEPADTGSTGSGGPVNEGATPAGLLQALAEFADGQVPGGVTTITDTDLRGIEARLNQLINRVEKVEVES